MKTSVQFRALESFPGERHRTKPTPFRAGYQDTLNLLDTELRNLGARNVVIQIDVGPGEIRLDGMPRSDARPRSPAVVISFEGKAGPLQYPCCAFSDWRDNIRAIALALEALRKVDRYGVTKNKEQYKGWARLDPPAPSSDSFTAETAADYLGQLTGVPPGDLLRSREAFADAFKTAKTITHPDRVGVDAAFKKVGQAGEVLCRRHGL